MNCDPSALLSACRVVESYCRTNFSRPPKLTRFTVTMTSRYCVLLSLVLVLPILAGCGKKEQPFRKDTTGVVGQVIVDGEPVPATKPLKVDCHNVAGFDQQHPTVSSCLTGEDGKFQISTYETGDGVPEGDYVLTFMWGRMDLIGGSYTGPDQLNGKYTEPEKSEIKFTVTKGKPVDLGRIELSTSK